MFDIRSTIHLVLESIAMMSLTALALSMVLARLRDSRQRAWAMGVVMGVMAAGVQLSPTQLGDGMYIDTRALIVAAAGAFFGWRAFIIAVGCAVAMRFSAGGIGTMAGTVSVFVAGLGGLFWRYGLPVKFRTGFVGLVLLGVLTAVHVAIPPLFLPPEWRHDFLLTIGLPLALSEMMGALVMGAMLRREFTIRMLIDTREREAMADPLTELGNRRSCLIGFENLRANREGFSAVYLDIDHFKKVNDRHGHDIGDAVLRQIGTLLKQTAPPRATATRIGGEEFCILIPGENATKAVSWAEALRNQIAQTPFGTPQISLNITISAGVHSVQPSESFDHALAAADRALYAAKAMGRNRVIAAGTGPDQMMPHMPSRFRTSGCASNQRLDPNRDEDLMRDAAAAGIFLSASYRGVA